MGQRVKLLLDPQQPGDAAEGRCAGLWVCVPGLAISSYAKQSYLDHQTFSFDALLKLIGDELCRGSILPQDC
jgi:hypothetical protein